MSPLIPKGKRPWTVDPGHIHDAPEPPPMPDEQGRVGVEIPPEEIEVLQAADGGARAAWRAGAGARALGGRGAEGAGGGDPPRDEALPAKRSAAMPALWAVQRRYGWCTPEGIRQAAAVMGVTPGYLEWVASFYDLFRLEPEGEHQVLVCTNISCWLRGADDLLESFREAAGSSGQGTSEDGKLFVRGFECLGACDLAPMASIDERYYGPLTEEDAKAVGGAAPLRRGRAARRSGSRTAPAAGGPDAKEVKG